MHPRNLLAVATHSIPADTALLLLRIVAGIGFMMHGWGKIQAPFSWMGPNASMPGFMQALAAISEFGGGLAWALGLLTPLACLGIIGTMAVALHTHIVVLGDPFVSPTGGRSFEPAALYCSIAIVLLLVGPGRLSADRFIFGKRSK